MQRAERVAGEEADRAIAELLDNIGWGLIVGGFYIVTAAWGYRKLGPRKVDGSR